MPDDERLPGVDVGDDGDRIVAHVDADCFYAACERLKEPDLAGDPVVVGMGYEPGTDHGAVATASYEAREHGVESAQAISTALERLPRVEEADAGEVGGHYRPVDMSFYESVAGDVRSILREHADRFRQVSIDEAYLDVTDRTSWDVVDGLARHLRDRVRREVGVTVSVGVAPTMSAAKVASDRDKPDGQVVVRPGEVREFLAPLPVEAIHGVGPVRARELRAMGVETGGDLAATPLPELADQFGDRGRAIGRRARGEDDREVTPRGRPKSLSRESAFADPVEETSPKRRQVRTLAEAVADRARRRGALYRTVGIKAVEPPFEVNTRERSLPGPVQDDEVVETVALDLFEEFDDRPIRKVGVRVSNLAFPAGRQTSLDGYDREGSATAGGPEDESDAGRDSAPDSRPARERSVDRDGQTRLSEF